MIKNFADDDTEAIFNGRAVRPIPPDIRGRARRKLDLINAAGALDDLRVPPGNRLEGLHGDRAGTYSIRINDQWRICFAFEGRDAFQVEIVDYH